MLLSFLLTNLIHTEDVEPMEKVVENAIKIADSIPKTIVSENVDKYQVKQKIKTEQPENKPVTQQKNSNKKAVSPATSDSKDTSTGMDQNTLNWIVVGSLLGIVLFGLALIIIAKCMK